MDRPLPPLGAQPLPSGEVGRCSSACGCCLLTCTCVATWCGCGCSQPRATLRGATCRAAFSTWVSVVLAWHPALLIESFLLPVFFGCVCLEMVSTGNWLAGRACVVRIGRMLCVALASVPGILPVQGSRSTSAGCSPAARIVKFCSELRLLRASPALSLLHTFAAHASKEGPGYHASA